MNIDDLENNLQTIVSNLSEQAFIYNLLLAYGQPKATITRLQKGDYNLSKKPDEILWKKKLFFKKETHSDLHGLIDNLKSEPAINKHHPRFIVVTDFQTLLSVDTSTKDTLDIPLMDLPKHFDFFLPWAGMEKSQLQSENPADIKAAERMGYLYDIILQDNPAENEDEKHALNIFLSRLLFCFFAEDTGIFADDQFTNAVASHTAQDGSDLQAYLQKLYKVLNLRERSNYPKFLQDFPYVNGGLFADESSAPKFSAKSRKIIIECGALNWKAINPDIFGSMMQTVMRNDQRSSMGMHYTSVVNIMKVIEPLFLNDLHAELAKAGSNKDKLRKLLNRLYHLRIFDPACGSGNFLIIAYKELCKLEIEVFKLLHGDQLTFRFASNIKISQFYGIELEDFAQETAKLSLWLAEHQMNLAFKEVFGKTRPTLPLQDGGNIVCGNASRLDWEEVCPKEDQTEIYILGNPPYLGSSMQTQEQKVDMALVFDGINGYKNLDYIACWFLRGARYIHNANAQLAFVSTNSISQGEQVAMLWPNIFSMNLEIGFAHQSFKWTNNARGNAGVTCIVVGIRNLSKKQKIIFNAGHNHTAKNINPYLANAKNLIITKRVSSISRLPVMTYGNKAVDGGHLILSKLEKEHLIANYPKSETLIKRLTGSSEFIRGTERFCLWITDNNSNLARSIPPVQERVSRVKDMRLNSKDVGANKLAERPHQFRDTKETIVCSIIVPSTTSERREYIPMGFLGKDDVITNAAHVLYDPPSYIFAILSSRIHMTWIRTVAGRLKTDYRYSSELCYNTFPFPDISDEQKTALEDHVFKVLDQRERHLDKTVNELYDPDKMPDSLRKAHYEMDLAVEKCYRQRLFKDDDERLEYLLELYEEMIEKEKGE